MLAANFLGFTLSDVGLAEFFSVYAGLQVGLALAMLTSSMKADYLEAAIFFSLVTSTGLFVFRVFSLFNMGNNESLYAMAALEGVFVIILALSFYQAKAELKT
jgi:hypothetical protein